MYSQVLANPFSNLQLYFCSRDTPSCSYHIKIWKARIKKKKIEFENTVRVNLDELHSASNLRENRIVLVVLLGLSLQLRSSLRHKRGHLVDNESGVWILWGRDFKQAMSTFTLRAPMTTCQSQGNCTTGVCRRCTEMSKPRSCPEIHWKTQALNYLSSLRIWSNQPLLPHRHHLGNKTHSASGWERDSSWTVSSSWTD